MLLLLLFPQRLPSPPEKTNKQDKTKKKKQKHLYHGDSVSLSDFPMAVKCTHLHNTTVPRNLREHLCVSARICICDCNKQLWPLAIQPLLIWTESPQHSPVWPPLGGVAARLETFTAPYWHLVAPACTASTWCLAGAAGRWRTVYKWHLPLIKSCTCRSTWSAEGLASTVAHAGPLILR